MTVKVGRIAQNLIALFNQPQPPSILKPIGKFASQFHTAVAATNDRHSNFVAIGCFQGPQPIFQPIGIGDRPEGQGMFRRAGDPVHRRFAAQGQHQPIVGQGLWLAEDRAEAHLPLLKVDRLHGSLHKPHLGSGQQLCKGRGHLPRLQLAGHQLIQQGQKHESIAPIDQQNFRAMIPPIQAIKAEGRIQTPKAPSQNHNPWASAVSGHRLARNRT